MSVARILNALICPQCKDCIFYRQIRGIEGESKCCHYAVITMKKRKEKVGKCLSYESKKCVSYSTLQVLKKYNSIF